MSEDNLNNNLGKLISYSLTSTLILGFGLIFLAMIQDNVLFEFDAIATTFEAEGLIGSWVLGVFALVDDLVLTIPAFLDMIWLISFLALAWGVCYSSYFSKREGYFGAVSLMTYGVLILLFISSWFIELSEWFNTEIVSSVLPSLSLSTPFYTYYLAHAGVVNAILIVLCILLNVFDFDFATYNSRKDKEMTNREEAI